MRRVYAMFAPPPQISVSEWARKYRILPKGTTPRPGQFTPETFQIEMMDVILSPTVHEIVVMKSTQIGYNEAILNNVIAYYICADPKPIMMISPTIENSTDYGKKRITPMIESCPELRKKIKQATSRRAGNTLALKEFEGGFLKLAGANSGAGLRSDPVPIVLFDEIDGYPLDLAGEGDPISIGTRRTDAYHDYKIVKGSTPAKNKGSSPIETAYERSDKRRFHVACPHCGHMQVLWWRDPVTKEYRLYYELTPDNLVKRDSVAFICAGCKAKIPEKYKQSMLDGGKWIAEFPARPVVGFHLNALYSPWRNNWADIAGEWHEANAERNPEKLKAFINLRLGETWEEDGDALEVSQLKQRCETYHGDVPMGVGLLTAAVDVQGDRLEVAVKGWGHGEESWLITWQQFYGDPGRSEVWEEVDEFLSTEFVHENGRKVKVHCTMVDSGGNHSDSVYRFVKVRQARRIFALKGSSETSKEILSKFSTNNSYRVKLYTVGVDTAKDRIFSRMKIPVAGPGYMHIPDWVEEEYLHQLTSEKKVRRAKRNGRITREYVKMRNRNEALDLEVYNLCALYASGHWVLKRLKTMAEELAKPADPEENQEAPEEDAIEVESVPTGGQMAPIGRPQAGSSWVKNW